MQHSLTHGSEVEYERIRSGETTPEAAYSLDPRNASDWLFCYALTAQDDESMGMRLEQVIDSLYADVKDE